MLFSLVHIKEISEVPSMFNRLTGSTSKTIGVANPQVIKSNLQRPSIFSSAYVENRNSAIPPIPSSKVCFAYCAKPEPAQQAKTQCPSLCFAENHPNGFFF